MRIWVLVELVADQTSPEITLYFNKDDACAALNEMAKLYVDDGTWTDVDVNTELHFLCDEYEAYLMWLPVV